MQIEIFSSVGTFLLIILLDSAKTSVVADSVRGYSEGVA